MWLLLLAFVAVNQASTPKAAPEQPGFDDRPAFVVSGVTDYTYRGGHGSDTVLRSTEALTAATASLKNESASKSASVGAAAREHEKAEADEKRGDSLQAVHEYQRAADLDPSETNFFDLGTELLTHRAADPATEVFTGGRERFPDSVRMLLGLAASLYMRGEYDRAAEMFFRASDLRPANATPYLFLGKVQSTAIVQSKQYLEKLARFALLAPDDAWSNYYYAAALWKQRANDGNSAVIGRIRELSQKAATLDPKLGEAYLLLGNLDAGEKNWSAAIPNYQNAIKANPTLEEPHYRLSQAYAISGDKVKSREELDLYKQLSQRAAKESERERKEVQQFVYTLANNNR